jgi:hypothetical protein
MCKDLTRPKHCNDGALPLISYKVILIGRVLLLLVAVFPIRPRPWHGWDDRRELKPGASDDFVSPPVPRWGATGVDGCT